MPFLTHAEITTLAEPTRITFHIERERGWDEWLTPLSWLAFCLWLWSRTHMILWLICGLVGTAVMVAQLARSGHTELIVTADELVARGNIGRIFSSGITLKTADITAMQYRPARKGASAGLYVHHAGLSVCLVQDISEDQTNQMLDEIFRRLPNVPTGDRDPSSMLFGPAGDLTSLKLK